MVDVNVFFLVYCMVIKFVKIVEKLLLKLKYLDFEC